MRSFSCKPHSLTHKDSHTNPSFSFIILIYYEDEVLFCQESSSYFRSFQLCEQPAELTAAARFIFSSIHLFFILTFK